jgi:CheY-like chemotaxis protein
MPARKDILVVEDDPDMAEIIVRVLRQAGYATRRAENGQRAVEAVGERMPALVLLDMLMSVMDGWQCASALRTRYGSDLPIVVLTAAEDARVRGAAIAADDVLAKPFELHDLMRIVARYADNDLCTPPSASGSPSAR